MNNTLFNLLVFVGLGSTLFTIVLLIVLISINFIRKKPKGLPKKVFVSMSMLGIISVVFWISWIVNPNFLPQGHPGQTVPSPNGDLKAQVYHMSGFIDYKNVRVDIINNETKKKELIYYDYVDKVLDIMWVEEDILKIEDKYLQVDKDKFDYRTQGT